MSKIESDLFSGIRGKYGKSVFRTPQKTIVMYPQPAAPTYANEEDLEARDTRADQFGGLNELVPVVNDAAKVGFADKERGLSAANLFVSHNSGLLVTSTPAEGGGFTREYAFRELRLSAGPLEEPDVTATVDTEARSVSFTLASLSPDDETGLCQPTDRVYGFVLDGATQRGRLVELGTRGEGGMKTFNIPAKWAVTDLYVYAFARARRKRQASPTVLLYPAD